MNRFFNAIGSGSRALAGGAVATLLVVGLAWHGAAATEQAAAHAATVSTPIAHAVAGGRDSYADVVDVVSPAVVTIRTTGKARMMPTEFQGQDDDLFRRFFGEQFGFRRRSPGQSRKVIITEPE